MRADRGVHGRASRRVSQPRADAATLLERALIASAAQAGAAVAVESATQTRWASATFTGARHTLSLALTIGDWQPAQAWLAGLPETELPLRGHLVADLAVVEIIRLDDRVSAIVEVLTVEER